MTLSDRAFGMKFIPLLPRRSSPSNVALLCACEAFSATSLMACLAVLERDGVKLDDI
jgi:hypothetical protein